MKHLMPYLLLFCATSAGHNAFGQNNFKELSAKDKIAIAEREQVEAATDQVFQDNMEQGHALFQQKHYLKAIRAYEQAEQRRPYNVYPKVKIADIEASMADTLATLRKKEEEALKSKPRQSEPATAPKTEMVDESKEERIKKLDDWEQKERNKMERERERKDNPHASVAKSSGDVETLSLEDYQKELAEKYPGGITEERLTEGNKTIIRRIVVREGKGNEYRKVEHSWGGVFFFKNGDAVTERVWKNETE